MASNRPFLNGFPSGQRSVPGVYRVTNLATGRFYIGQTYNIAGRRSQHLAHLRKQKSPHKRLLAEFSPFNEADFDFRTLESVEVPAGKDLRILFDREAYWIRLLKPQLNRQPGDANYAAGAAKRRKPQK